MRGLGIKLHYLHRDEGNYKEFGSEIFTNKNQSILSDIENRFKPKLIDSTFFYPNDFGVKKFHVNPIETANDWYEFEKFEEIPLSDSNTESMRDVEELLH